MTGLKGGVYDAEPHCGLCPPQAPSPKSTDISKPRAGTLSTGHIGSILLNQG